jgi:hypothetical protein
VNQTYNTSNYVCDNWQNVTNVTNNSWALNCTSFHYNNITNWYWTYEPIWLSNISSGSISNAAYTSNLNAHGSSVYQQTSKDSYTIVRFCGDYLYDKDTLSVAIDTIPKLMGTEYTKYTWWNISYAYKKAITVNTASAKTNYPIPINISYGAGGCENKCRADFTDLIFVNASENEEIPYYCEANISSSWIYCWFTDNWTSNNGTQAYIYYGNNSITSSHSNGKNTFTLFDDYDDASYNTTIWATTCQGCGAGSVTEAGGNLSIIGGGSNWQDVASVSTFGNTVCAVMSVAFNISSPADSNVGWGFHNQYLGTPIVSYQWGYPTTGNHENSRNYIVSERTSYDWGALTSNQYYRYSICRNGTTSTVASFNWLNNQNLSIAGQDAGSLSTRASELKASMMSIDYWFIRSYSYPEPDAPILGSEQNNGGANASWVRLYINGAEANATHDYTASSTDNLTATVNVSNFWVSILRNGTLIANGTNSIQNINVTGVGYWNITSYGQSNASYTQNATTYWMNITKANNPLSLANNYSWAFNYPNATNITGYGNLTNATLYRNGSDVANPDLMLYGVGNYNFTYYTAGNANYTANSTTSWLNISKGISTISMTVNLTNYTINYGTSTLALCTGNAPSMNIYRNWYDTSWHGLNASAENNTAILLNAYSTYMTHCYTCNTTGNANYTNASSDAASCIYVYKGTPPINITFNTSDTVIQGATVNITCNNPSQVSVTLYNDTAAISNPYILNTTGLLGVYNLTCNTTGSSNYTVGNGTKSLTVTSGSGLSIYVYDEENTTKALTFNITVNNGTVSNTAYLQTNPYTNSSITGSLTIDIIASGYQQRTYYITTSAGNATNLTAYLLSAGSGSWVIFYVYTPTELPIQNALINVERLIPPASWLTIAQKKTDSSGSAAIFLSTTTTYRLNFSAIGYINVTNQLQPAASPYVIYMIPTTATNISYNTSYKYILYYILPQGNSIYQNTTNFMNYYISSSDGTLAYEGWQLTYFNGTQITAGNASYATGYNFTYSLDTNIWNSGYVTMNYWFMRQDYSLVNMTNKYYIYSVTAYNTSIQAEVNDIAAGVASGNPDVTAEQFAIISILITIIGMAAASSQFKMFGSGIIGIMILSAMTWMGTYIYGDVYIINWAIVGMFGLGVISAIWIRGGFS